MYPPTLLASKADKMAGLSALTMRNFKSKPARLALTLALTLGGVVLLRMSTFMNGAGWERAGRAASWQRQQQRRALGFGSRLPSAEADLGAVLAGGWEAVDLAPLDALSSALTKHLNGSERLEGHSAQLTIERKMYYALASMPAVRTICEIGFNGGHSAALWLHANPAADVYMFDLWSHGYSPRGEAFLRGPEAEAHGVHNASARLHIIKGSSALTVPTFAAQHPGFACDLLSVDGGHKFELAVADITNMAQLAGRAFHVLLVDDTNCGAAWCVDAAFQEQQRRGMVRYLAGFSEHPNGEGAFKRGITVAQYLL